jgi:hypothetical protein
MKAAALAEFIAKVMRSEFETHLRTASFRM